MKNYLLFYTDLMPDKFSGFTLGFVILLRPKAKEVKARTSKVAGPKSQKPKNDLLVSCRRLRHGKDP